MTRSDSNLIWALALLVAAVVLATKDEMPIPWAIGLAALVVGILTVVVQMAKGD